MVNKPKQTPEELGFIDWNTLSMEDCIKYLRDGHKYSSDGESWCIMKLIDAYEKLNVPGGKG